MEPRPSAEITFFSEEGNGNPSSWCLVLLTKDIRAGQPTCGQPFLAGDLKTAVVESFL